MSTYPIVDPNSTSATNRRNGFLFLSLIAYVTFHACWSAYLLFQEYLDIGIFYGGFRLLGSPQLGYGELLIHLDFAILLAIAVTLAANPEDWPTGLRFSPESSQVRHRIALGAILILGAVLLLWKLGVPPLWQDEAQSALISRTVMDRGVPLGSDGFNYFSQEFAAEYANGYLWRWHTWLPFYLVAGCYKLFGESTWSARFPAVVMGWLTIPLVYRVTLEIWRDRRAALASAGLLSIHVGMILLSRQCRYYSATSLFTIVSLWGYWRLLHQGRWGRTLLIAGMVAQFHTHYVYTGICGLTFLIHTWIYRRDRMKPLVICAIWVVVLCSPWIIWFSQMKYAARYGHKTFDPFKSIGEFNWLFRHVALEILPWTTWILAFLVYRGLPKREERKDRESGVTVAPEPLLCGLIAAHLFCLAPIIPAAFCRYLTPVIPLAVMLGGRVLSLAYDRHPTLAAWGLAVFILSTPLDDFVHEQVTPIDSPMGKVVEYLKSHARVDEVIVASYSDLPLIFYLPNRVYGTLSGETLPQHPDWILMRHSNPSNTKELVAEIQAAIDQGDYERITLNTPDMPVEHREAPNSRAFRLDNNYPPMTLYHLRSRAAASSQSANRPIESIR